MVSPVRMPLGFLLKYYPTLSKSSRALAIISKECIAVKSGVSENQNQKVIWTDGIVDVISPEQILSVRIELKLPEALMKITSKYVL